MKKFDPTKPVQTRDGKPARIMTTDCKNDNFPIAALIDYGNSEIAEFYTIDGFLREDHQELDIDLVNCPEKHVRWLNVYSDGGIGVYSSREIADKYASALDKVVPRIACICIEFEEGDGL